MTHQGSHTAINGGGEPYHFHNAEYKRREIDKIYKAEDKALSKTLERYSEEFIEALEYFGESLQDAFEEVIREEADDNGVA